MKSKLNPVLIILVLFLFKVGIVDHLRFKTHSTNDTRIAHASHPKHRN